MAGEDPHYTDWLKMQACYQCDSRRGCDPHHRQGAGMGMRSHDHTAIPLCRFCHVAWHAGSGPYKWMGRDGKREYADKSIAKYRALYRSS